MKLRLDRLLVSRGLVESREKAQALIMAGEVLVAGQKAVKPGQPLPRMLPSMCSPGRPTSAAAEANLPARSRHFAIDVAGKTCLDIGASTGGFTDALLQAGAARVHAVDVGAGQLAWQLRTDPRVVLHEGINAAPSPVRARSASWWTSFAATSASFP
jgi:23S rRNA (cytidine1920-2'-O)/16S rRNA (cytidine1409-2'-O)-methyltransferase